MNLFFKDLIVLQIYENIFWNLSKLFNLLELHSSPHEKVLRNLKGGHGWSLVALPKLNVFLAEPNIFLRICTHTHTIPINNDLCPPMPTHSMTCAHPCPPMLFKLRPCFQKLCNVYYPPTPSLGWIGHIKCRILSMASAWSASWLAYSLHLEVWLRLALDAGMHKTNAHPCPPTNNNIAPMPTQNPWVQVGMGMGTQCRALLPSVCDLMGCEQQSNIHNYGCKGNVVFMYCPFMLVVIFRNKLETLLRCM